MEYLIMAAALAVFVLAVFGLEGYRAEKEKKRFIQSLRDDYGKAPEREYSLERYARMDSYFRRHPQDGQLDDITWNDLGMDAVFKRINHTLSASGEEYLYYTLRSLKRESRELEHFEEAVRFFQEHEEERVQIQVILHGMGYMGKYSLYDYLDNLDYLGKRSNKKSLLLDLLFVPMTALLWIQFTAGILGLVCLTIYNIVSYFKEKGEIEPYIVSFAYVMRLLEAADKLEKISVPACAGEWERLERYRKGMQGLRRNSFWVMSPMRGGGASSGNVLEAVTDYIRMVFHVDLIKFNNMLNFLRGHTEEVDGLTGVTGYLETAISAGAFRKSLKNGYCVPELGKGEGLLMTEGYHPLLENPVKNSIRAERGILLTGSNASGKSTFLKTVAVNAVLAQTLHTCAADCYRAPFFYVFSSMALTDNLAGGESYYIVEIKALKRILDAAAAGKQPVLCFVDEVLRGTNTVERIAASSQILNLLGRRGILCFAATHDIELTELLSGDYENYHFEEDVRDGDVHFNYELRKGSATTRNAIKLLELLGYDREMIDRASKQAAGFLETGVWRLEDGPGSGDTRGNFT